MTSNYNVLYLPAQFASKYKVGDVFKLSLKSRSVCGWRILRFDGLEIKNIDFHWGLRLHFDYNEWAKNKPADRPEKLANQIKLEW